MPKWSFKYMFDIWLSIADTSFASCVMLVHHWLLYWGSRIEVSKERKTLYLLCLSFSLSKEFVCVYVVCVYMRVCMYMWGVGKRRRFKEEDKAWRSAEKDSEIERDKEAHRQRLKQETRERETGRERQKETEVLERVLWQETTNWLDLVTCLHLTNLRRILA